MKFFRQTRDFLLWIYDDFVFPNLTKAKVYLKFGFEWVGDIIEWIYRSYAYRSVKRIYIYLRLANECESYVGRQALLNSDTFKRELKFLERKSGWSKVDEDDFQKHKAEFDDMILSAKGVEEKSEVLSRFAKATVSPTKNLSMILARFFENRKQQSEKIAEERKRRIVEAMTRKTEKKQAAREAGEKRDSQKISRRAEQ